MKKLCIITPSLGKYSETFIQNQVDYLPFEKTVITLSKKINGKIHFGTINPYSELEFADAKGRALKQHSFLNKNLFLLRRKILKENYHYQQERILSNYLKREGFDHVLIQYGTTAYRAFRSCINSGIPYSVHFHGGDAYRKEFASDLFYKGVFEHAKNIIVVSEHMKQQLTSLGANPMKIHVVNYGSNFEQKDENKPLEKKGNINFLAVGRFVEKKAPYLTILAFSKAYEINKNIRLKMIGNGDLLYTCENIVSSLNLNNVITFEGALTHNEVNAYFEKSDAFIQHSIVTNEGDSEGLPNSIIEALRKGLPVISTEHAGIPEIVKDGINGFLTKEGDIQGMKESILKVAEGFTAQEIGITMKLTLKNYINNLTKILNPTN